MSDPKQNQPAHDRGELRPWAGLKIVKAVVIVTVLLGCSGGAIFLWHSHRSRQSHGATVSCANHVIHHSLLIRTFLKQRKPFPATLDVRQAFEEMSEEEDAYRLRGSGAACPESFRRDGSLGYVYLADGLAWKSYPDGRGPLVFVCPAESHQGESQHAHAVRNGDWLCLKTNREMIALLQAELAVAEGGEIAYSSRAIALLNREIAARQRFESKRTP